MLRDGGRDWSRNVDVGLCEARRGHLFIRVSSGKTRRRRWVRFARVELVERLEKKEWRRVGDGRRGTDRNEVGYDGMGTEKDINTKQRRRRSPSFRNNIYSNGG